MCDGNDHPPAGAPFLRPHPSSILHLPSSPSKRSARTPWPVALFLAGFTVLLILILNAYLKPAAEAARNADKVGKHELAAWSWLLLAILLVILFAGLTLTFRFARFFSRNSETPTKTIYTDAWSESAKRLKTPPEDDQAE